MATTLYMRPDIPAVVPAKPSGYTAGWTDNTSGGAFAGSGASSLLPAQGDGNGWYTTVGPLFSTNTAGCLQMCSPRLAAQTIAATPWSIAFSVWGGAANWQAYIYVALMNGSSGLPRTVLIAANNIGTGTRPATSDRTVYSAAYAAVGGTAVLGDYLVVEIALKPASSAGQYIQVETDGNVAISADNVNNGQPLSLIICPTTLVFAQIARAAAGGLGLAATVAGTTGPGLKSGTASAGLGLLLGASGSVLPTSKSGTAQAALGVLLSAGGAAGPGRISGTAQAALGLLLTAAGPGRISGTAQAALGLLLTAAGSGMVAVPVPIAPRPRTSYPEPVLDPGSAPGDTPLVYIPVNKLWLPYICGCLMQLQQRSAWSALNQQQLQDLIGRVNDLIAAFGAGEQ